MAGKALYDASRPIRIFMTADAVGGVWQYSLDLAGELVQHDAEVLIATMGPRPSEEQKRQALSIPRVALAESDYALEWMPTPWRDVDNAGRWLLNLAASFGADVIHLNGYSHAGLRWNKPVIVIAHSCIYSWWNAVRGCTPDNDWAEYKCRVTAGLQASDAVVAPSAYMAQAIQREYGVESEKVRLIHNFSRTPRTRRSEKISFLLAAGRIWDPAKNLSLFDRIAPHLRWEIHVAGNGSVAERSVGATKTVRFLGSLPHTELLYQMEAASIFAHPALYEPFGLSVLEAARRECCLVLSDIPSLRELWAGVAVFADPHDPEAWIFELNKLVDDRDRRRFLGYLAHSHASKYRADTAIEKYVELYRWLASARGRKETAA
jgi:glycogen synthase